MELTRLVALAIEAGLYPSELRAFLAAKIAAAAGVGSGPPEEQPQAARVALCVAHPLPRTPTEATERPCFQGLS